MDGAGSESVGGQGAVTGLSQQSLEMSGDTVRLGALTRVAVAHQAVGGDRRRTPQHGGGDGNGDRWGPL